MAIVQISTPRNNGDQVQFKAQMTGVGCEIMISVNPRKMVFELNGNKQVIDQIVRETGSSVITSR